MNVHTNAHIHAYAHNLRLKMKSDFRNLLPFAKIDEKLISVKMVSAIEKRHKNQANKIAHLYELIIGTWISTGNKYRYWNMYDSAEMLNQIDLHFIYKYWPARSSANWCARLTQNIYDIYIYRNVVKCMQIAACTTKNTKILYSVVVFFFFFFIFVVVTIRIDSLGNCIAIWNHLTVLILTACCCRPFQMQCD